jgi:hypothetical protein
MGKHTLKTHSYSKVLVAVPLLAGLLLVGFSLTTTTTDAQVEANARHQYGSVPTLLVESSSAVGVTHSAPRTVSEASGIAGVVLTAGSTQVKGHVSSTAAAPMQYQIRVANTGGEEQLDACTGGFTHLVGFTTTAAVAPQRVLAEHNNCGGDVVLALRMGDLVKVAGDGTYKVVESRDTVRDIVPSSITGIKGSILLQTCYHDRPQMRFVGLEKLVPEIGA